MREMDRVSLFDLLYGIAISVGVYVDLWQYGVPDTATLVGVVYGSFGIVFGASIGLYRGNLSSRTELIFLALFTVTAFPLLHVTSSAELGLTLVAGTWTAIAVECLHETDSTGR